MKISINIVKSSHTLFKLPINKFMHGTVEPFPLSYQNKCYHLVNAIWQKNVVATEKKAEDPNSILP